MMESYYTLFMNAPLGQLKYMNFIRTRLLGKLLLFVFLLLCIVILYFTLSIMLFVYVLIAADLVLFIFILNDLVVYIEACRKYEIVDSAIQAEKNRRSYYNKHFTTERYFDADSFRIENFVIPSLKYYADRRYLRFRHGAHYENPVINSNRSVVDSRIYHDVGSNAYVNITPINENSPYVTNNIMYNNAYNYADNDKYMIGHRSNIYDTNMGDMNLSPVYPTKSMYRLSSTPKRMIDNEDNTIDNIKNTRLFFDLCTDLNITLTSAITDVLNLKQWLLQKLMTNLVTEIEVLDSILIVHEKLGIPCVALADDKKIEEWSKLSLPKPLLQYVDKIKMISMFLDVGHDRKYVLKRIKEFVRDESFEKFIWDKGSDHLNTRWTSGLPTDAMLIMHLFLTFIDTRLFSNSVYRSERRAFTSKHFKSLDNISKDNSHVIVYQELIYPHRYNIVVNGTVYKMPVGESNVFYTIVCLLHCLKKYESSLMNSLNLRDVGLFWISY